MVYISAMNNHVLLILSMHRSGTSALTRVLSLLGAELPRSMYGKTEGNQRGHWESDVLVDSHDALLKKMKSSWSDWRPLAIEKFAPKKRTTLKAGFAQEFAEEFDLSKTVLVMKDPRVCKFAPLYIEGLSEAGHKVHPILIVRNPLEVAGSLESRDGISFNEGLLLWLSYMLEAERASRGHGRVIATYENFLQKPVKATEKIAKNLACPLPYTAKEMSSQIKDYVSPSLKRHKYKTEDVVINPVSRGWVSRAYEALLLLADTPDSKKAGKMLDDVRSEFQSAAPPLYKFIQAEKDSHRQLIAQLKTQYGGEREEAQAAYEAGMAELERNTQALLASRDEAATQMLRGRDEDMSKLQAELQAVIADLEAKLHQALKEKYEVEAQQSEQDIAHKSLQEENTRVGAELEALSQQLERAIEEKSELAVKVGEVSKECGALKQKIREASEEKSSLTHQVGSVAEDKEALWEQIRLAAEEKSALLAQIKAAAQEKSLVTQKHDTMAAKTALLSQQISDLSHENSALADRHRFALEEKEALFAQLNEASKAKQALSQANETLTAQAQSQARDFGALERSKAVLQEKQEALEALNRQLKGNVEDLQKSNIQLNERAEDLSRQGTNLETQLNAAKVQSEARAAEIEFMRDNFGKLRSELEESVEGLSSALGERESALGEAVERERSLRAQLEAVLGSTSWKMTGGMRALLNMLRGRKPAAITKDTPPPRLTYREND